MDNIPNVAADVAWQSMNNVCDNFNQTSTPARRRSRKSWFETPPATTLDIAFEKKKRRSSGAGRRKSVENMETLLLTHFTNPPKITFGKVKLGKTRNRHLLIKNPHDYEQEVVIEKFPYKKKFTTDCKTFMVPAEDCIVLTFNWTPEEDGNVREMVLFRVDDTYRLQTFLLGCAESPKQLKKHKKGLLGAKVKRPFSILHTPGLACIRDNYSPQEVEKQPFVPGKYNVLQENAHIQNKQTENTRQRKQVEAFPPPALESTAIAKDATSVCRSKAYNNMADIGCSPTLPVSDFSPIPNSGSEMTHLVDSCCSIMQTSPLRDVVLDKENGVRGKDAVTLEAKGPEVMFTVLDRKERKDTEKRETFKEPRKALTPKSENKRNSDPANSTKEFLSPDSFLNDSLSMQTVDRKEFMDMAKREIVRKPRKSWTPHRKSPLRLSDPDQSEKKYLSPDSFLNDSIVARQSGIGATPGTPFTETIQAFNHDEFEKSIVSPNSFLEELNSTRNDSMNADLFTCIPSPAILTDEDTHNIFMKQLRSRTVKTSHFNKNTKITGHVSKATKSTHSVNFSVSNMVTRKETVHQTKQTGIFAPTVTSSRRATFVTKKSTMTSEKISTVQNVPSPRRATFLVKKNNNHAGRKISPKVPHESARAQKKLTRSQRFTNIHKAEVVEQKMESKRSTKTRSRSKGNGGETVIKKSRKTKTEAFLAAVEAEVPDVKLVDGNEVTGEEQDCRAVSDEESTSATVTKEKAFMVIVDEDRNSIGRELFGDENKKNSSATITKDKPFMEVSSEDKRGSGKCLFPNTQEETISELLAKEQQFSVSGTEEIGTGKTDNETEDMHKIQSVEEEEKMHLEHGEDKPQTFDFKNSDFGSPSKMMNDIFVGDSLVGRMSMTVTKERPSLSTIQESGEQSKSSTLTDTSKVSAQNSISSIFARDSSLNNSARRFSGKKLFGADPMSPSKSPILSSIFRDIGSPSRLPSSPDVEVTRRITLTVTKERPSDALREATMAGTVKQVEDNATDNAFVVAAKEETYVTVSESNESYCRRKKILGTSPTSDSANYNFKKVDSYEKTVNAAELQTLREQTSTWEVTDSPKGKCQSSSYTLSSPMFSITPHAIPNSPSSENSRRSTHVIPKPKVLDPAANSRRLFPPLDGEEQDSLVMGELERQEERLPSVASVSSAYSSDSLEASSHPKSVGDLEKSKDSESNQSIAETISEADMNESVFEKDGNRDNISELIASVTSQSNLLDFSNWSRPQSVDSLEKSKESESKHTFEETISEVDINESVFDKDGNSENISPQIESSAPQSNLLCETALKPRIPEAKESMILLKSSKVSTDGTETKTDKKRRRLRASKVSPTPVNPIVSPVDPPSAETKEDNKWFIAMDVTEKDKCVKTEVKRPEKKSVLSHILNPAIKKRSMTEDKENVGKEDSSKKRSKSDPTETSQPKKQSFLSRLTSTGKKTKPASKGLAQSKLILVKKGKRGMPKHPLPFAAKNMYYDERWIEKQDRGFVHWLNFVLTPPDEYNYTASKTKVDAGSLNIDASKFSSRLAPTKEVLSIRAYTARRRLNRLRRSACMLYQSEQIVTVIHKLEYEVEKKRVSVRKDRMLHADIGIKQRILDMLLCYNPLWLRMGLETVFGEVLPLQSNSDVIGLSHFILYRLLGNPDVEEEYAHPTVPHLYRDGYAEAIAKHALKKFLLMVYFLDQAKVARLIQHDPCLFCKDADIKASKDMLIQFSRDYLSGEGDITKHLAYMGYTVSHTQTALDEFNYAVTRLGVDLRDGLRLTRVLELLTGEWNLVKCLRAPAISRLQKIHNIEMVFKTLAERGLDIAKVDGGKVSTRDIVDGHREKTLKILWHLIFHFQVDVLINIEQLREEVGLLEQSLRVKVNMQRLLKINQQENFARRDSGGLMYQDNERLELLLKWCRVVCLHYGVKVENFTVSFSDGRALCCLLHHYHPALLPLTQIHLSTSQSYQQELEDQEEADLDLSQDWNYQQGTGFDNPELFEQLLANERENFKTLYEKVSELGGIPLMLKAADMSNTIPDEKVVVTYVSYLCGRLLDIRQESRAARVIQIAWRHYRLRTALREQHHEIKAARVIQIRVKAFLQRKREECQARAAVVLQAAWRGRRARSQVKLLQQARKNAHMKDAVVKIQAVLQGYAAKSKYQHLRRATVTLQSHVRGHLTRRHIARQHTAANTIQSLYKCSKLARRQQLEFRAQRSAALTLQRAYRVVMAKRLAQKSAAASVLQRAWKSYKSRKQINSLKKSAVVLQGYVRTKQRRKEYLQLRNTALTLQRRVRANKMGQMARQEFLRQKSAAIYLQAHLRGLQQRKEYTKVKDAVTCIQKHFRGHKYRVKFQAMRLAATMIQRAYRFHKMAADEREALHRKTSVCVTIQRWWRLLRQQKLEKQTSAAVVIQAAYRRHVTERQYRHTLAATKTIQRSLRMMLARKQFLRIKVATTVLQHYSRLHLSKRQIQVEMQSKKNALVQLQSCWRRVRAERQYKKIRHATIILQKNVRMMQAQAQYRKKLSAVKSLQHHARGYLERKKYVAELSRQSAAAVKVQTWLRMCQDKRRYLLLRWKTVVLQAEVRCWRQRKMFLQQRKAAVVIQTRFRAARAGQQARVQYQVMIGAAMTIQNVWRGHVIRRGYISMLRSVVKIQSWTRKVQAVRRYQAMKKVCIALQRHYRANKIGKDTRREFQNIRLAVIKLQACARSHARRREFLKMKDASVTIQKYVRMYQQRVRYRQMLQDLKMERATVTLQKTWRMVCDRKRFRCVKEASICIQRWYRAVKMAAKCRRKFMIKKGAAITIQAIWRSCLIRRHMRQLHHSATVIQAQYRACRLQTQYSMIRRTVIGLQHCYRRKKECVIQRQKFVQQKQAAVVLQKCVRTFIARRSYQRQKNAVITIQRAYHCHRERVAFLQLRQAAVVCQRRFQASILARQQRQQYCQIVKSVVTLQAALRGWVVRKQVRQVKCVIRLQSAIRGYLARRRYERTLRSAVCLQANVRRYLQRREYLRVKLAAKVIQERWRATLAAKSIRKQYLIQVGAAITIQQGYRTYRIRQHFVQTRCQIIHIQANIRGFLARRNYQHQKQSVQIIQSHYRAQCQAQKQRKEFLNLRSSACVIQTAYRKWKHRQLVKRNTAATKVQSVVRMYLARQEYCCRRHKVILLQALVRGFLTRCVYRRKQTAVVLIQRNTRTFLFFNNLRDQVARRRHAACVLQRAYRKHQQNIEAKRQKAATVIQSTFRMHHHRKRFRQTCHAAILIQSSMRGLWTRQTYRESLRRHRAATSLQKCFRGYRIRVHLKKLQAERKAQLELYTQRVRLHLAAVRIQTWYRKCVLLRHAHLRLASIIAIQRRVRVFLERLNYLKLRNSATLLQRQCRQWLATRHRSAVVLQTAIRHWLYRQRQHKLHHKVAKIQAVWRGYQARKSIKCKKINRARARCKEASHNATDDKKLGNRTTSALDYLLQYKSLSHILEALMHLDIATRLSPRCCERLVEVHAVHVIYRLIRSCNRSLPHMELIKYSINILLNLAKYDKTVYAVHDVESTEILVDLMQIYREKGSAIFSKTCSLVGILALDPRRRMDILQQSQVIEKIRSIHSLVSRRNKVEERQKMVRAKLAASRSFNSTLPLPTPVKRRRIRPEWALKRDSLNALQEPMPAINFVLENLHLPAK